MLYHITAKNIYTKRVDLCCEMCLNEDIKRDGEILWKKNKNVMEKF